MTPVPLYSSTTSLSRQVNMYACSESHLSSDLSLDKHVSSVSVTCFYHLRQLRCIRCSLDADSAATLIHAFMTSRVRYCNAVLTTAPKTTTDRLQHVLNALHESSATPRSLIRDCHDWCTRSYTGWTAGSADPPVSARQGASVPIKLLPSSQSSSYMAAFTLRCTSSTDRTSTLSQHLRSAGICCCWSDDV